MTSQHTTNQISPLPTLITHLPALSSQPPSNSTLDPKAQPTQTKLNPRASTFVPPISQQACRLKLSLLNPQAAPFTPKSTNSPNRSSPYNAHNYTIATVNTRSWYNKVNEISHQVLSSNIHILGVTETWLHDGIPDPVLTPSSAYTLIRRDRPRDVARRGGGVAFLLHSSVQSLVRHDLSPSSSEFEILCLQLLSCDRPTYVFLCYRPTSPRCPRIHKSTPTPDLPDN